MATYPNPPRYTDPSDELAPTSAPKNRLMLLGMAVFGALLVGIVIFALVTLLGPDHYDRVTLEDLVERPTPSLIVAPMNETPTAAAPVVAPTAPESTPQP